MIRVMGRELPVASSRRRSFTLPGGTSAGGTMVRVTYHPSAVLRAMVAGDPGPMRKAVIADLKAALRLARRRSP